MLWVLRRQLKSSKTEVRRQAVERLARSTSAQATTCLALALEDEDPGVRALAAAALTKSEDGVAVDPLLRCLRDRSAEVIKAALPGLRRFPDLRTPSAVAPLLRHPDSAVRSMAAQLLDQLGWHPADREDEIWFLTATNQYARAATFGVAALPAIEAGLSAGTYGSRIAAVEALGQIQDSKALRPLLTALKASDPGVCIAAIDALCRREDGDAANQILSALKHAHSQVRASAVEALGRMRSQTAFESIRALLEDPVWEVRKQAAEALGRLRDPRALDALGNRLEQDLDHDVREAVAVALGNVGARQGIGRLVLALKDPASGVRRLAAASLSRIDTNWSTSEEARAAAEKLKASLQDPDLAVRQLVSQVLINLGVTGPSRSAAVGAESVEVESSPSKRCKLAVSLLMAVLCDLDADLRQAAAEALGELGDERAGPALLRAKADEDPGVRTSAEIALRRLEATPR
jgi:HEAT repeat protein